MARKKDRERAIRLRKQGYTYSEIREKLGVPKSTLSGWLSKLQLSSEELMVLSKSVKRRKYLGIEKTRLKKSNKRKLRLAKSYKIEKSNLLPLSKRELYLSGLFLYWGEGRKNIRHSQVSLSNTDPEIVKFFIKWLVDCQNVPRNKLRVVLHLYYDMDAEKSIAYWSKELGLNKRQFVRPYMKNSSHTSLTHSGYKLGTCNVYVSDILLKEKIMQGIKAIYTNI